MKMPEIIEEIMFAPCGMNCAVCYKHVCIRKYGKPCEGCLKTEAAMPAHCRNCKIKSCAKEKGVSHCFECSVFPCKVIGNLEKTYIKKYNTSLIENSILVKEKGKAYFLEQDKQKWTCKCGGAFSLHDGVCSDCGEPFKKKKEYGNGEKK